MLSSVLVSYGEKDELFGFENALNCWLPDDIQNNVFKCQLDPSNRLGHWRINKYCGTRTLRNRNIEKGTNYIFIILEVLFAVHTSLLNKCLLTVKGDAKNPARNAIQ